MKLDALKGYYLDGGYNCAESVLRTANEEFGLGLDEKALRTAGGFGGGMGCGNACGALCGAIQALGAAMLSGRAADCPGFRDKCGAYFRSFEEALGSSLCAELGPKYKNPTARCYTVVRTAYELLEKAMEDKGE